MGAIAVAWALNKAPYVFPIIGGRSVDQLEEVFKVRFGSGTTDCGLLKRVWAHVLCCSSLLLCLCTYIGPGDRPGPGADQVAGGVRAVRAWIPVQHVRLGSLVRRRAAQLVRRLGGHRQVGQVVGSHQPRPSSVTLRQYTNRVGEVSEVYIVEVCTLYGGCCWIKTIDCLL